MNNVIDIAALESDEYIRIGTSILRMEASGVTRADACEIVAYAAGSLLGSAIGPNAASRLLRDVAEQLDRVLAG